MQKPVKTGKYTKINKHSDVKFWLNWIKYETVLYWLSCTVATNCWIYVKNNKYLNRFLAKQLHYHKFLWHYFLLPRFLYIFSNQKNLHSCMPPTVQPTPVGTFKIKEKEKNLKITLKKIIIAYFLNACTNILYWVFIYVQMDWDRFR